MVYQDLSLDARKVEGHFYQMKNNNSGLSRSSGVFSNPVWQYALVAVMVFAGTLLIRSYFSSSNQAVKLPEQAKLREYVAAELPVKQASAVKTFLNTQASTGGSIEPDDCKLQRDRLVGDSFERVLEDIQNRRLMFNPACQAYDARVATASFAEMIYRDCKSAEMVDVAKRNQCAAALFFYKSALVANATKSVAVRDMDAQTLSHHLFSMLGLGEMKTPAELSRLSEITDRLIEELPNSPGAYKAALIPRLIQEMNGSSPENTEKLAAALDKARALNPGDAQVEDINLFMLTRDGRDISVSKAEAVVAEHPDSSAAQLFLAKAYARHADYARSAGLLATLAARYPNDPRIQEAVAQMKAKDYDKLGHFQIGLGSDDI